MFDGELLDDDEFPGGVFSDEIDGGRAGAVIRVGDRGITARTSDNDEFVVGFSDCNLQLGGESGRMLFCRTADRSITIFCEDRRFPEALKRASAGDLYEQLEELTAAGNRQRLKARAGFWTLAALALVLAVAGWFGLIVGARVAVTAVPIQVDEQIGSAVLPEILSQYGQEITSPQVRKAVQSIVDRLAVHGKVPDVNYDVRIIDSDIVNAMALPGGKILVFQGLIDSMETTEQLAAVLAHEMAHVTLRHHLRQIASSVGIVAAVSIIVGDAGGVVALGAEVLQSATLNNYSQTQETEADLEGARMMHDAELDPRAMIKMLGHLPDAHLPDALSWLATHPDSDVRAEAVQQLLAGLPVREYSQLEVDLADLRQRLRDALPEDAGKDNSDRDRATDDEPVSDEEPKQITVDE